MKKIIGWIETLIGLVVALSSLAAMTLAKTFFSLDPFEVPIEGVSEALNSLFSVIPVLAIAYFLIILVLGVFIFLEGLSKIGN